MAHVGLALARIKTLLLKRNHANVAAVSTDNVNLNDGGYRRRSRIIVGSLLAMVLLVGLTTLCSF